MEEMGNKLKMLETTLKKHGIPKKFIQTYETKKQYCNGKILLYFNNIRGLSFNNTLRENFTYEIDNSLYDNVREYFRLLVAIFSIKNNDELIAAYDRLCAQLDETIKRFKKMLIEGISNFHSSHLKGEKLPDSLQTCVRLYNFFVENVLEVWDILEDWDVQVEEVISIFYLLQNFTKLDPEYIEDVLNQLQNEDVIDIFASHFTNGFEVVLADKNNGSIYISNPVILNSKDSESLTCNFILATGFPYELVGSKKRFKTVRELRDSYKAEVEQMIKEIKI